MRIRKSAFVGYVVAFHVDFFHQPFGVFYAHVGKLFYENVITVITKKSPLARKSPHKGRSL